VPVLVMNVRKVLMAVTQRLARGRWCRGRAGKASGRTLAMHGTTWERIWRLVAAYLPPARILHPWPGARFAVKHPRWEPGARIAPAGICAGGVR